MENNNIINDDLDKYPIYIIYSGWSIEKIYNFLNDTMKNSVCMMKIIYDSSFNETNKTIAVLNPELYDILINNGYSITRFELDFKIKKYKFKENIFPPPDKSSNLFIPIFKTTTETLATTIINKKLENLAQFGILPNKSWRIKCPINSRENGYVKLGCFIFFKSDLSESNISVVRFLLNNTHWNFNESNNNKYDNIIKCNWARHKIQN